MLLPRFQLFELEDLTWFPHTLRDLATDYLHFMETRFALHKPVVPLLRAMLENSRTSCVVDLCSGGGGPVLAIYEDLAADEMHVHFTLTDKFPNTTAFQRLASQYPSDIQYIAGPVDATNVPKNLVGLRTTLFIRPFRWKRLLWTYVIPLIPLTCWWDGLVSACRAYTVAEMLAMTQGFDDYEWKADRIGVCGKAGHLTHLLGIPRSLRT
jgi:hypothetical protein